MNSIQIRAATKRLLRGYSINREDSAFYLPDPLVKQSVNSIIFEELIQGLKPPTVQNLDRTHEDVIIAEAYLRYPKETVLQSSRGLFLQIAEWVTLVIIPSPSFAKASLFNPYSTSVTTLDKERSQWQVISIIALRLMSHLCLQLPELIAKPSLRLVTGVATFTDNRDLWTTHETSENAQQLLSTICDGETKTQGLLVRVLESTVKPLFQTVKNPAITEQGRKAVYPTAHPVEPVDAEGEMKPWKFQNSYIVTVFRWIISRLSESSLVNNWSLVIPPLLAMLDDEDVDIKKKGCELLSSLLEITPSSLLQRTGLGEVFHNALTPCLSHLPSLTPESQSLQLLNTVYPTLIVLTRVRYSQDQAQEPKIRCFDGILRIGVLRGYIHAGEYVNIAEMLLNQLRAVVYELGIWSVKHLKDLVPLLLNTLSNPFGTLHPPLLVAGVNALEALILNCWPRIGYYRGSILKGITTCWCMIQESHSQNEELGYVERSLRRICHLMKAVLNSTSFSFAEEMAALSASDHRLLALLET